MKKIIFLAFIALFFAKTAEAQYTVPLPQNDTTPITLWHNEAGYNWYLFDTSKVRIYKHVTVTPKRFTNNQYNFFDQFLLIPRSTKGNFELIFYLLPTDKKTAIKDTLSAKKRGVEKIHIQ